MAIELGTLKTVDIRKIWPSEPGDFTPWLADNIKQLSDILEREIEIIQKEYAVGGFSADIVAKDLSSSSVIVIENQYGASDHKHLGQILLYCAGVNASCVIWIAESFKDEHRKTIEWLNNNTMDGIEFYAIQLEIIQIDDSRPVPLFKAIESPKKNKAIQITENSDTQERYRQYFQILIDELREKHKFTNAKVGQPQNWYAFSSENSKIYTYNASFALNDRARVEIYLDSGDKDKNKDIFDKLFAEKEAIGKKFSSDIKWERLDDKRACRIAVYIDGHINLDTEELTKIKEWSIEKLLKFKEVFPEYIKKYI
ncbi:MAG: DUF4268 domain-containing protein [Syntrophorhabdaceae bacterium]|nr:DUF4268 domain-containing protein [Syntrophorhabdaceae bacterium]